MHLDRTRRNLSTGSISCSLFYSSVLSFSLKERTSHQTINPHHLLQHQQHFQQQQMHNQQHGYYGNSGWRQATIDPTTLIARREDSAVDEYAGLMQQREKDWIIRIQLLQLQTDNPYVDDYYHTVSNVY